MIIPLELIDYRPVSFPIPKYYFDHFDFTRSEAEQYYSWFLSSVDIRAAYLRDFISEKRKIAQTKLDYSPDSLVLVWEWFLSIAFAEPMHGAELDAVRKRYEGVRQPEFDILVKEHSLRLSTTTEYVLFDIGMYIAKMFMDNYPCLKWSLKLKPKRAHNLNLPLIVGFIDDSPEYNKPFYPELDPIDLARTPAMKLIRAHAEAPKNDDLLIWCRKWMQWIPDIKDP